MESWRPSKFEFVRRFFCPAAPPPFFVEDACEREVRRRGRIEVEMGIASFVRVIREKTALEMVHLAVADYDGRSTTGCVFEDIGAEGNEAEQAVVVTD